MARPPVTARWLSATALLMLLSGGSSALLLLPQGKASSIAIWLLLTLLLVGTGWLIRLLYYRVSVHNAFFYYQLVAYEQQQWWMRHRQTFALLEGVLLGPAGTRAADWLRLPGGKHLPPQEKKENGVSALRLPQISATDPAAREKRLAELLITEWQKQHSDKAFTTPLRCYWQGADAAWQAFSAQMAVTFPNVSLPLRPEPWQGEASLAAIASGLEAAKPGDVMLIAGCQTVVAQPGSPLPAGESAVLWLAGKNGPVQLARGEVFTAETGDMLPAVCARALEQSELKDPPEACPLFANSLLDALKHSGWDVSQHLQDASWGDIGSMEGLTVLSLAAIYAAHHQQPCGWIARDPINTLALGIVKPDGQSQ